MKWTTLFLYFGILCYTHGNEKQSSETQHHEPSGTVAFHSVGTTDFAFDVFQLNLLHEESQIPVKSLQITDGISRNYNACPGNGTSMVFVSERDGNVELYHIQKQGAKPQRLTKHHALDDKPTLAPNDYQIAFVSTRQPSGKALLSWNAIYVMDRRSIHEPPRRLTPKGYSDFSPAWSPNGKWIAFAQYHDEFCQTFDIGVMKPDGTKRTLVVKNGGWPTWSPDSTTIYFHSFRNHHWGIYSVNIGEYHKPKVTLLSPKGIDVMTPNSGPNPNSLIVAAKLSDLQWRQIYQLDITTKKLLQLTYSESHHYNPALSKDGKTIYFHKCHSRGNALNMELVQSHPSFPHLAIGRSYGAFPSFSTDGKKIAVSTGNFKKIQVSNIDGSNKKTIYENQQSSLFGLSWSAKGYISFSEGPIFHPANTSVDIVLVDEEGQNSHKISSKLEGNKAFASFSPKGDQIVFRGGASGFKNLYTMSSKGTHLKRLTRGNWTDTMPNWAPSGEWIAFSREHNSNFSIWMIRPNGTEEHKVFEDHGRCNHVGFSPDSKKCSGLEWFVFASDYSGCSVEAISVPFQFQPYGEIFIMRVDGTGLVRLTHNGYEDGTPSWGKVQLRKASSEGSPIQCHFSDIKIGDSKMLNPCPFSMKLKSIIEPSINAFSTKLESVVHHSSNPWNGLFVLSGVIMMVYSVRIAFKGLQRIRLGYTSLS